MAIFHLSAKVVSRGSGQSAIAKAAYNARAKLQDERTGETKDYSRLDGVAFSAVFAPKDAPAWAQDRQRLWNEVERREDTGKRAADAQLARQIIVALPCELTDQQREWLVKDYVRELFTRKGMVADVNIHQPSEAGDERNHHVHILLTMRVIDAEGFGPKVREWNSREQVEKWREEWERLTNRHLERHGFDERIDRRSLEDQGAEREPTTHRGPHVDAIERKGIEPEKAKEDAATAAELVRLKAELLEVQERLAAERELFIQLNEAATVGPAVMLTGMVAEAAGKVKDIVREFIAPAATGKPPAIEVEEKPDWKCAEDAAGPRPPRGRSAGTCQGSAAGSNSPTMKSRGDGGIPRQEPTRTTTEKQEAPAHPPTVFTILDDIRRWALRKAFVRQFKLIAERVIPRLQSKRKRRGKSVEVV